MSHNQEWSSAPRPNTLHQPDHARKQEPAITMAVVDIGTDFSSIWNPAGATLSEPSAVAVDHAGAIRGFGVEAILAQAHRRNHLVMEKPFAAGRLLDPVMAEAYLAWLFKKAGFVDVDSIPVFLPLHANSSADTPLSRLVAGLGGDPVAIHRPVAAAIDLDIAANSASNHLMVELWEEGAEVAVIRGGLVVGSETVHTSNRELAVAAINQALDKVEPDAQHEIQDMGIHLYGWAAQQDALTLASMTTVRLASPLGSGATVLSGARLLAESVLPWLAGSPASS